MGEQGKYDASVSAAIINGRFGLHIPYYRLQDIFSSSGWRPHQRLSRRRGLLEGVEFHQCCSGQKNSYGSEWSSTNDTPSFAT
jgi:hypothetical protein